MLTHLEVQRAARSDLGCRILLACPCRPPSSPDSVGGRLHSGSDDGAGVDTASAAASATTAGACSSLIRTSPRPPLPLVATAGARATPGLVGGRIVL